MGAGSTHTIHTNGTAVETASSFRLLWFHISEDLTWSQWMTYKLCRLKWIGMHSSILCNFYWCIEYYDLPSLSCCTMRSHKGLQRVVKTVHPSGLSCTHKRVVRTPYCRIIMDLSLPSNRLFVVFAAIRQPLPVHTVL